LKRIELLNYNSNSIKQNFSLEENVLGSTLFDSIYPRFVLGLDVSTACIGVCVLKDNGDDKPEIMYLSHKTPKIPKKIKGIEKDGR